MVVNVGRVMFVSGALEYERPFLGPLYRFMSLHLRNSIRLVPPAQRKYIRGKRPQEWTLRQASLAIAMVQPRADTKGLAVDV